MFNFITVCCAYLVTPIANRVWLTKSCNSSLRHSTAGLQQNTELLGDGIVTSWWNSRAHMFRRVWVTSRRDARSQVQGHFVWSVVFLCLPPSCPLCHVCMFESVVVCLVTFSFTSEFFGHLCFVFNSTSFDSSSVISFSNPRCFHLPQSPLVRCRVVPYYCKFPAQKLILITPVFWLLFSSQHSLNAYFLLTSASCVLHLDLHTLCCDNIALSQIKITKHFKELPDIIYGLSAAAFLLPIKFTLDSAAALLE